jgi:hypothetical protein
MADRSDTGTLLKPALAAVLIGAVLAAPTAAASAAGDAGAAAPDTSIVKGPKNGTLSHAARFRFSSSTPGAKFRCRLDRGAFERCDSPARYRRMKRGRHVLRVAAVGGARLVDPTPAVHRWRIARRYNPELDVEGNDLPPPPGSPAAKFEQHCIEHPAICG